MTTHRSIVRFSHILAVLNNDHLNIVNFSPHLSYSFIQVMHMYYFFPHFHCLRKWKEVRHIFAGIVDVLTSGTYSTQQH